MITNPVYDPGDGTVEENTKEQNRENTTYNEIKDITVRISCNMYTFLYVSITKIFLFILLCVFRV